MSLKGRLWMLPVAAALVAAGALLYSVDPGSAWWMPSCLFHQITGLYCPGCGTGRGLHKLLNGDLVGAWRLNPLMVLAIPLLAYLVTRSSIPARPNTKQSSLPTWLPWLIVGAIIIFWVARNIPAYPFTLLAPH